MTHSKEQQLAELKRHFGRRVMDQARLVINAWQSLDDVLWNPAWHAEFVQHCAKLHKLAGRYESERVQGPIGRLVGLLEQTEGRKPPSSNVIEQISDNIRLLADGCSRRNDDHDGSLTIAGRKPVYICFEDTAQATSLAEQLNFFGIPAQVISDQKDLDRAMHHRLPAALIVGVEFDGDGVAAVKTVQANLTKPAPVFFQSLEEPDIHLRLAATRANGVYFQEGQLDIGLLVKHLSNIYNFRSEKPFRVLVVDDSKAQAMSVERTLNGAGMVTQAVTEPMTVLSVMQTFQPDAVLMDMYMPGCTGIELAQVIRQQQRYDTVPIVYLSAEQDLDKQMDAMGQGGDDFLTKPAAKEVLITTVRNRCLRNRGLKDQMIRDSLTGLLDHINTLGALNEAIQAAREQHQPLCFAMIDIDHFKDVNDTYGHAVGDRVIRSLALYLRQRFRMSDSIGRYGGEEFALVLPDTTIDIAEQLLNEVCHGFSQIQHEAGGEMIHVSFSAGVASMYSDQEDASTLSRAADEALYVAKRNGRARVCVYGRDD
ncbi:GGDEF domain-containing response regulator [Saccharospirillum salsuginis]|uniref:diguanylate cyclase n=1 Tax=Saccharospirillum salsuginis TaxID=418750 RepID=A0A918NKA9_9GAMM|nr:diguanylate cyclase [Saccharospirillum salsuginis]GGX74352.1 diguanylate cyclase response regulator [Saccharospirillum salsuginis]